LFLAIGNYSFSQNVNVSSTVPVTTINYATLRLATQAINNGIHGSLAGGNAITVKINGDITETTADTLKNVTGTPITIYPTVACTIYANFLTLAAVLTLDNADNVTFDGRLNGTGAKSLRVKWTANGSRGVKLVNGSSSNNIRFIDFIGFAYSGTIIDVNAGNVANGGNNNNTIESCTTTRGTRGIQTFGLSAAVTNVNTIIKNNRVSNALQIPINCSIASDGGAVTGNEVTYDSVTTLGLANSHAYGIQVLSAGVWTVANNNVHDLIKTGYTANYGIIGILIAPLKPTSVTTHRVDLYNNMVTVTDNNNANFCDVIYGIYVQDGGITGSPNDGVPYTSNIYNNTTLVGGDALTFGDLSWSLINDIGTGAQAVPGCTSNTFNNIAINRRFNTGAGSQCVGMEVDTSGTSTKNTDYNFAISTDPFFGWNVAFNGFLYEGLELYKATACVFGWEGHTVFKDANFVSNSNLHLGGPVGGDMNGLPTALVTTDIDGAAKNGLYPYRGADEGAALKVLTLNANLEGKIQSGEVTVMLINGCVVKSTSLGYLNTATNSTKVTFGDSIPNSTAYTLGVSSINHMTTFSSGTPSFAAGLMSYSFISSQSQAFGGNQTAGPPSAFFGGDANGDSTIDVSDVVDIYNDGTNFVSGCRLATDINSDEFVDVSDLTITYNNAQNFVGIVSPCPEPATLSANEVTLPDSKVQKFVNTNSRIINESVVSESTTKKFK
ncbi:MAG: hypothetical protein ABI528_00330, partial [bacterium]